MNTNIVTDVAHDFLKIARKPGFDPIKQREEIVKVLSPFVGADERLFEYGIKRPNPPDRTRMIFYSPELVFFLSRFGTDFRLPVHNHDAWNVLLICSGEMHFRWYRRSDSGADAGKAKVEIADDRIVKAGDVGIVAPPPNDIHELEILTENTWMLTVAPCFEPDVRDIHNPAQGTFERKPLTVLPTVAA
jgi:hypothetical protein